MTTCPEMDRVVLGWVKLNFEVLSKRKGVNIGTISLLIPRLIRFS